MKRIAIGLTAYDSKSLAHECVELSVEGVSELFKTSEKKNGQLFGSDGVALAPIPPGKKIRLSALGEILKVEGLGLEKSYSSLILRSRSASRHCLIRFPASSNRASQGRSYGDEIVLLARHSTVRVLVQCSIEDYLSGVLSSEIPATYHLEAIKAQAIAARTYALNPRVDHSLDHCQVCDSFLCCQCYSGHTSQINGSYSRAINETNGQVMIHQDQPILALFSACGGGHTENYESCFSDLRTNAFPPEAIPYLKGVPEGILPTSFRSPPSEKALADLWHDQSGGSVDAWAPQFRWSVKLTADSLEANMHHVVDKMSGEAEFAPFVIPPPSAIFGHIESFQIESRGLGGTAISMAVNTSKGTWMFRKELVIRTLFENHEVQLPRLKSARIYFQHEHDGAGFLKALSIYGLGSGHGVGLQQAGAEGWARLHNKNCQAILAHYFKEAAIARL